MTEDYLGRCCEFLSSHLPLDFTDVYPEPFSANRLVSIVHTFQHAVYVARRGVLSLFKAQKCVFVFWVSQLII
jgi:hypothetical protein